MVLENEIYQMLFISSKNIDPSRSYGMLKVNAYLCVIPLCGQFAENDHFSNLKIYVILQLFADRFETLQARSRNDFEQICQSSILNLLFWVKFLTIMYLANSDRKSEKVLIVTIFTYKTEFKTLVCQICYDLSYLVCACQRYEEYCTGTIK